MWASRTIRRSRRMSSQRSEEHTSELQSQSNLVCRLLLEKKNSFTTRRSSYLFARAYVSSTVTDTCHMPTSTQDTILEHHHPAMRSVHTSFRHCLSLQTL